MNVNNASALYQHFNQQVGAPEKNGGSFPLVSVVLPFHNTSPYFEKCVASVVRQLEYPKYELILIDDGSTDESTSIAITIANNNCNVSYYRLDVNRGVSAARNLGISKSRGAWISFLDSDDLLPLGALKKLAATVSKEVDAVFCGYSVIDERGRTTRVFEGFERYVDGASAVGEVLKPESPYQGHVWGKAFRRDILKTSNTKFDETVSFYEDELFLLNYLKSANIVSCVRDTCYQYRRHHGQISDFSIVRPELINGFSIRTQIIELVTENWPDVAYLAKAKYMLAINSLIKRALILGNYSLFAIVRKTMKWDCFLPAILALKGFPARQAKVVLSAALVSIPLFARLSCYVVRKANK